MKTTNIYSAYLRRIWQSIRKISIAIVTAIPSEKIAFHRSGESTITIKDEKYTADEQKHHHRPISKPAVEQQTLLKETKKQKGGQY